ncbi:DUF3945 domain-containing protein [Agriterribacter sp.]|uniref:DUF3945 domain-containing protein n=1 Tax=Agriterribacter sp. TaxID=2821509 RepID=UPI002C8B771B|nr:DUF3945 domain-containing protein [Agriterribacter sp.]HRO46320.1 DUF3945 domain-containing protein [Agriterribacter sp.]HRQ17487.1 DUF3945 domain-containing protein [Agriterribacter sp.]
MNEQNVQQQSSPDQLTDILLVLDKEKKKIQAVKGIDKNGGLETVEPNGKNNSEFMRVDKHGDIFSNFFSNFLRQLKDPTRFSFFKIPVSIVVDTATEMQKHIDTPTKEGEQLLSKYEVKTEPKQEQSQQKGRQQENTNNMETTTQAKPQNGEYRYTPQQIDWETMSNLGLSKERLEKMNLLDPLLKGYKTNELVPISLNLGTAITRMDARLSLQSGDNGQAVVAIHGIRKEPQLNFPFFGHAFTKEDKDNLLKTGNMGRVVDLTNSKTGETIPSIISVDRLTNELIALRTDKIKAPDEIKGVKLDEQQKQVLQEGKPLYIEGMISKKGDLFNATVQYNADKRYVEFLFNNNLSDNVQQNQGKDAPRFIRGKELDDNQYQRFKDGQTIYVPDLKDKEGKEYKGYLTFNKETAKTEFSFSDPNKLREKVKPTEEHKTQTAVNSEGKTNEATKNIKEPLKSGQKEPDSKKQQEKQTQKPAKSKGRKI